MGRRSVDILDVVKGYNVVEYNRTEAQNLGINALVLCTTLRTLGRWYLFQARAHVIIIAGLVFIGVAVVIQSLECRGFPHPSSSQQHRTAATKLQQQLLPAIRRAQYSSSPSRWWARSAQSRRGLPSGSSCWAPDLSPSAAPCYCEQTPDRPVGSACLQ